MHWFFTSDLHGQPGRYAALFAAIRDERPAAVLLGGDLTPHPWASGEVDFWTGFLRPQLVALRDELGDRFPEIVAIPGNDDPRAQEASWLEMEQVGLWRYAPGRWVEVGGVPVLGYPWVPPTPFLLKDWERYDVSRFTDPGCVAPEDGRHSTPVERRELALATIAGDLERLAAGRDPDAAVLLCHSPPYETVLDRAALDGRLVDHVPLDVHVGSIALRRFLERWQPALSLHGHVHESARLTGAWRQRLGRTWCLSACTDESRLGLVSFDPAAPERARRRLIDPPAS